MPKKSLYYFVEEQIKPQKVIFANEKIDENIFGLSISDIEIFYDNIEFGKIKNIDTNFYIFYNSITLSDLIVENSFAIFLPKYVMNMEFKYTITNPTKIIFFGVSDIGEINGDIDFIEQVVSLDIKPTQTSPQTYSNLLSNFENINGVYRYEYRY